MNRSKNTFIVLNFVISCVAMLCFGVKNKLDRRFYYSGEEAMAFFSSMSVDYSHAYLVNQWVDLYYIFSYGLFFYFLLSLFYQNQKTILTLIFFPAVFDLIETSWIIFILATQKGKEELEILGWMTCLKWISVFLIFIFLLVGVVKRQINKN